MSELGQIEMGPPGSTILRMKKSSVESSEENNIKNIYLPFEVGLNNTHLNLLGLWSGRGRAVSLRSRSTSA